MHRVLWLPAHPSTGAVSMDRYWQELDRQRRQAPPADGLEISCALGAPPAESRVSARLGRVWQKYAAYPWRVRRLARAPRADTVHLLDHAFAHLLGGVGPGVRKIATVHDLAPLRDASDLTPEQLRRFRRTVEHLRLADLILADSRHSAAEAVEFLALDPGRVRVLPLGVNVAAFARPPGETPGWAAPLAGRAVVLSIGMAAARKNLRALPAIFRALRARRGADGGLVLLRVGERLPPDLAEELRGVLGAGGLVELGRIPNLEVVAAYHRADALLLPSLQEGFGFPVLEAMAAGCPVVCTNVTSLPEIGGEAAWYFSPDDPAAAGDHLHALLVDPAARRRQAAAGRRQAGEYSWERHFARLRAAYRGEAGAAPPESL